MDVRTRKRKRFRTFFVTSYRNLPGLYSYNGKLIAEAQFQVLRERVAGYYREVMDGYKITLNNSIDEASKAA